MTLISSSIYDSYGKETGSTEKSERNLYTNQNLKRSDLNEEDVE